jgi:uncharacterized tellurite resistance protein B-like protein
MFASFLKRLTAPEPAPLPATDARLALGALLVRVARSDETYDNVEATRIKRILAKRYGLNADAAAQLRSDCEALEAEAPDTVRFTRAIKNSVRLEDRKGIIEALWDIALADGQRDAAEDAVVRLVAGLLGVTDVESATARRKVQAGQA